MEKLYLILTWGIFWIMLSGAVVLIFAEIPKNEKLENYRNTRYLLSFIYLLMALASIMQLTGEDSNALWYSRIVTLWIGCSMASSLTIINITLLNSLFFSFKKFFAQLVFSIVFAMVTIIAFLLLSEKSVAFGIIYYLFLTYYLFVMTKFTLLLIKEYRAYKTKFDNFFSESETNHLSWILQTQIIATGCGVIAFISLFLPFWFACVFSLFIILFYSYYAIRFINYPLMFPNIEPLVVNTSSEPSVSPLIFSQLEYAVMEWENKKSFLNTDVTIELVAKELYTNRTYLSNYINTHKKKSFKQWITDLRINEAQRLLLSEPHISVGDIAFLVGFSDKSNFTNRFSKNTGESPKRWREIHLHQN